MRFCFILAVLLVFSSPAMELPTRAPVRPTRFAFESGGMMGWQKVKWNGEALTYEKSEYARVVTNRIIKPSDAQWRQFWAATEKIELSKWRSRYINDDILDGWVWHIEITRGTQVLDSFGRNATPDELDVRKVRRDFEPSKRFAELKNAVEKLLGFSL